MTPTELQKRSMSAEVLSFQYGGYRPPLQNQVFTQTPQAEGGNHLCAQAIPRAYSTEAENYEFPRTVVGGYPA